MPDWPRLHHPDISFDTGGTPLSNWFGDIYYSPTDGIAESETVFLNGIGAPDCWSGKPVFTIGETGFGTGLNFLLTWLLWRKTAPGTARLNYVSVEGYPLSNQQIRKALEPFVALNSVVPEFIAQYPVCHAGYHRLTLDQGRVHLTLMFGDAETMLNRLAAKVDAWFLDGFAPSKNPDMWSDRIYRQLAQLSAPNAKLATFTAAGHVRRGLQAAGFDMQKSPGFGRKKERLTGQLSIKSPERPLAWTTLPAPVKSGSRIAVVGSGIAGSSVSHALRNRGYEVTVLDKQGLPGGGMAGNPAAVLSPKPPAEASLAGRINALGFLDSLRRYDAMHSTSGDIWFEPRGVSALSSSSENAKRRVRSLAALNWPECIARIVENTSLSKHPIAQFSSSGCVDPVAVCGAFNETVSRVAMNSIERNGNSWILKEETREIWQGDAVVIAAGGYSRNLPSLHHLPLHPSRGQVSLVDSDSLAALPQTSLSFDGYLSPSLEHQGKQVRVLGSSFDAWRDLSDHTWNQPVQQDHEACVNALRSALNVQDDLQPIVYKTWSGLRAAAPDRIPLLGAVSDERVFMETFQDMRVGIERELPPPSIPGLYIFAGLGSRGYQLGPLLGEVLADMIAGDPIAIERDLLDAMNPNRFLARDLRRGEI